MLEAVSDNDGAEELGAPAGGSRVEVVVGFAKPSLFGRLLPYWYLFRLMSLGEKIVDRTRRGGELWPFIVSFPLPGLLMRAMRRVVILFRRLTSLGSRQ